jgi:ESF2/ABP1 family protein
MGGGGFYAHDLWNVKYLHKFKWSHLTEKIAYEARVRQDKMRAELSQAKKEASFYLQKVDQAKAINAMEERKRGRAAAKDDADATKPAKRQREVEPGTGEASSAPGLDNVRRHFKQRRVVPRDPAAGGGPSDGLLGSLLATSST